MAMPSRRKSNDDNQKHAMKVTVLSGFLGAGKTTLLKRILRHNSKLPPDQRWTMAVIVNDMGAINLDAAEIRSSRIIGQNEELVELHNGCICCTLRGDLLRIVKQLSQESSSTHKKIDCLVIESTGISEPLPVAQTFVMDIDGATIVPASSSNHEPPKPAQLQVAKDPRQSLFHYARLDTLVTVVDVLNMFDVLGSIETLADENNMTGMKAKDGADVPKLLEEAKREQLAVVSNKLRSISVEGLRVACERKHLDATGSKEDLYERLLRVFEAQAAKQLPDAKEHLQDNRSIAKLWLDQIEFASVLVLSKVPLLMQQASTPAEGSQQLQQIRTLLHRLNPSARIVASESRTFDDLEVSGTLVNTGLFDMEQARESPHWVRELSNNESHTPETEEYGISSFVYEASDRPFHPQRFHHIMRALKLGGGGNGSSSSERTNTSPLGCVLRIKGSIWMANSKAFPLEFHVAGKHVEIYPSPNPFLVETPLTRWTPEDQRVYEELVAHDRWCTKRGDKRTRLVVIGQGLHPEEIRTALDRARLTEPECEELLSDHR